MQRGNGEISVEEFVQWWCEQAGKQGESRKQGLFGRLSNRASQKRAAQHAEVRRPRNTVA